MICGVLILKFLGKKLFEDDPKASSHWKQKILSYYHFQNLNSRLILRQCKKWIFQTLRFILGNSENWRVKDNSFFVVVIDKKNYCLTDHKFVLKNILGFRGINISWISHAPGISIIILSYLPFIKNMTIQYSIDST